jgi:hypothetical protein
VSSIRHERWVKGVPGPGGGGRRGVIEMDRRGGRAARRAGAVLLVASATLGAGEEAGIRVRLQGSMRQLRVAAPGEGRPGCEDDAGLGYLVSVV